MMLKCKNCKEKFEKPITIITTYEKYYGVATDFDSYTPMKLDICPYCESDDFYDIEGSYKEYEENNNRLEEDEDEFF